MNHASEPRPTAVEPVTRASRYDRLIRTLALVALGPVSLLATPMRMSLSAILASLVLASSLMVAVVLPRRLSPRLGQAGALLTTTLVLGLLGTSIGVLDGCSLGAAFCRAAIGAWTLVWMSFPAVLRLIAWSAPAPFRMLRAARVAVRRLRLRR